MVKSVRHAATRKLSRAQVAKILSFKDHEVAAMDGNQLHPARSKNRAWQYDVDEVGKVVQQLISAHAMAKDAKAPDGETAAAIFALIESKMTLPKIVMETKQPVAVVVELRHLYNELAGSVTLLAGAVRHLCKMLGQEFHNARDIFPAVARALHARLEEGRADALDFGQVLDPVTGKLRPVGPKTPVNAIASTRTEGHDDGEV